MEIGSSQHKKENDWVEDGFGLGKKKRKAVDDFDDLQVGAVPMKKKPSASFRASSPPTKEESSKPGMSKEVQMSILSLFVEYQGRVIEELMKPGQNRGLKKRGGVSGQENDDEAADFLKAADLFKEFFKPKLTAFKNEELMLRAPKGFMSTAFGLLRALQLPCTNCGVIETTRWCACQIRTACNKLLNALDNLATGDEKTDDFVTKAKEVVEKRFRYLQLVSTAKKDRALPPPPPKRSKSVVSARTVRFSDEITVFPEGRKEPIGNRQPPPKKAKSVCASSFNREDSNKKSQDQKINNSPVEMTVRKTRAKTVKFAEGGMKLRPRQNGKIRERLSL